ncbi:plasmid replication initiation protein [Aeromonas veronii]|uniref:plasmid replication initiation protein n=1 Tax=Aeromonas veronii TaxID=654 RepID=UPI00111AA545|nr:plasmid replication initiation protein [Aeromonas veronii]TNI31683.1 plasmid replication initiation protein [Aeromonas veronii]
MSAKGETEQSQADENYNFVQISRGYLKAWRGLIRKNGLAAEVLMYFVEKMGRTTNAVVCSYATLTEVTGYSRRSVAKAIKVLKDESWIQAVKIGSATASGVNGRVFWQAGRNAETEQDSDFHERAKEKLTHIPFVDVQKERLIADSGEQLPPPDQQDLDLD